MASTVTYLPAYQAAELIRRGEASSRELTGLALARVDAVNRTVNAMVELRRETALRDAAAADAAIARGDPVGPLHGVPVSVKEALNVAGMHTTWGNPAFSKFIADRDAAVVARLKAAGAVVVGKTNVALMLGDFAQTSNNLYGTTRNPWDPDRTPGGSSGGAAAAVAAGMTFLDYGSDLVGSIRIPASFCGVYGLKPSAGIVPLTGFQPPGPPVLDDRHAPVTSEVGAVLSDAVDALARAGATVTEGWPEGIDPGQSAESFGFQIGLFFACQQAGGEPGSLTQVIEQEARRMAARAAWSAYFTRFDAFLCPVNFTAAFPHDTRPLQERTIATADGERPYSDQPFWTAHPSLAGLPAVSAPAGRTPGGLPVGLQIAGPRYEDDTPITLAELLADVTGGYQPPPVDRGSRAV